MPTTDTTEKGLESLIVESLTTGAGYVPGFPKDYDRDHALDGQRGLGVDRLDVGAGVLRADETGIGLARQRGVSHVAAGPAQQVIVLDALRGLVSSLRIHVG